MNLGVVFAFFGGLLALGVALPGLLLAWALLAPTVVERARLRLERTPWRCVVAGLALGLTGLALVLPLLAGPGPLQALGWAGLGLILLVASVGMAGLAALMGYRLGREPLPILTPRRLVQSAVALELAMVVPLAGWFVLLPAVLLLGLGAATLALLRPAPRSRPVAEVAHGPQPS